MGNHGEIGIDPLGGLFLELDLKLFLSVLFRKVFLCQQTDAKIAVLCETSKPHLDQIGKNSRKIKEIFEFFLHILESSDLSFLLSAIAFLS